MLFKTHFLFNKYIELNFVLLNKNINSNILFDMFTIYRLSYFFCILQGQSRLVNHIRRSYSMSDLSDDYVDQPRSRDRSGSIPESEDELGKF